MTHPEGIMAHDFSPQPDSSVHHEAYSMVHSLGGEKVPVDATHALGLPLPENRVLYSITTRPPTIHEVHAEFPGTNDLKKDCYTVSEWRVNGYGRSEVRQVVLTGDTALEAMERSAHHALGGPNVETLSSKDVSEVVARMRRAIGVVATADASLPESQKLA